MNKSIFKNAIIVLLSVVSVYSAYKYAAVLKEKYALAESLIKSKNEAVNLQQEKQNLLQEIEKDKLLQEELAQKNLELKDYLRASKTRLTELFADYAQAEQAIEQLNAQYSILKAERDALIEGKAAVSQENEALKVKLSSVAELKKAIRELKQRMRKGVAQKIELKPKVEPIHIEKVIEGNRGFLMRDGKFTFPSKVRIEVIPAAIPQE